MNCFNFRLFVIVYLVFTLGASGQNSSSCLDFINYFIEGNNKGHLELTTEDSIRLIDMCSTYKRIKNSPILGLKHNASLNRPQKKRFKKQLKAVPDSLEKLYLAAANYHLFTNEDTLTALSYLELSREKSLLQNSTSNTNQEIDRVNCSSLFEYFKSPLYNSANRINDPDTIHMINICSTTSDYKGSPINGILTYCEQDIDGLVRAARNQSSQNYLWLDLDGQRTRKRAAKNEKKTNKNLIKNNQGVLVEFYRQAAAYYLNEGDLLTGSEYIKLLRLVAPNYRDDNPADLRFPWVQIEVKKYQRLPSLFAGLNVGAFFENDGAYHESALIFQGIVDRSKSAFQPVPDIPTNVRVWHQGIHFGGLLEVAEFLSARPISIGIDPDISWQKFTQEVTFGNSRWSSNFGDNIFSLHVPAYFKIQLLSFKNVENFISLGPYANWVLYAGRDLFRDKPVSSTRMYRTINWGVHGSLGVRFQVGRNKFLQVEGRYLQGLSNNNSSTNRFFYEDLSTNELDDFLLDDLHVLDDFRLNSVQLRLSFVKVLSYKVEKIPSEGH